MQIPAKDLLRKSQAYQLEILFQTQDLMTIDLINNRLCMNINSSEVRLIQGAATLQPFTKTIVVIIIRNEKSCNIQTDEEKLT